MAAAPYLLDTNVVLHLVRGQTLGNYLASTFGLLNPVYRPMVSVVTHGELLVIADRNHWGSEKSAALQVALESLVTVNLDDESVLRSYVEVQRTSRRAEGGSRELSDNDAWIAACARAAGATLLTTDRDFSHLRLPEWAVQFVDPAPFFPSGRA